MKKPSAVDSGSQNNLHCSCNGATSNGAAAAVCTGNVLARKVPNHSGASPGQGNKKPVVSLTHLPKRPPVDVEFKNLAYSVSEGRKRGKFSREEGSWSRLFDFDRSILVLARLARFFLLNRDSKKGTRSFGFKRRVSLPWSRQSLIMNRGWERWFESS